MPDNHVQTSREPTDSDAPAPKHVLVTCGSGEQQTAPWTGVRTLTWPELGTLLTQHQIGDKTGTCIVPATFRGIRRRAADADRIEFVMLDSDAGATLNQIAAAIRAHGWAAIISSTHSHLTTRTTAKRGNWDRFCLVHGDKPDPAEAFLANGRSYLPVIVDGAEVVSETDTEVTFEHQPCPKFRIAIPLLRPWLASSYDGQRNANAAWKERIEALAHALGLRHDQSCTDTSRLFYLPRRPADGPPPETLVLEGEPCDLFSLSPVPAPPPPERQRERPRARSSDGTQQPDGRIPSAFGIDSGHPTFTDPNTGEIFNLTAWAATSARHLEIVRALQARSPQILLGRVSDATKHHIHCPNEAAHTEAGADAATFIANASQSSSNGFVIHCRHAHCTGQDRLHFLHQMLEQAWLTVEDLQNPNFLPGQSAEPPLIQIIGGKLPEIIQRAEDALLAQPYRLYQRGSLLVRPGRLRLGPEEDPSHSALCIIPIESYGLAELLSQVARWERFDARSEDWVRIDAPLKVATTLMQRSGLWRLPILAGIISAPTLRPDGSLLQTPGYDKATGLILDTQGVSYPPIPDRPSQADAHASLTILKCLLGTFPFVSDASRSVALSAILTAILRRSLPTAPLHAFTAPVPGSGKSMLVDIASIISTGRTAGVIAQGRTEEELEKRLGALLLAGDQVIAIDNCEAPLGGEFLCALLTQTTIRARILGRSEAPEFPSNAFITATGNNLVLLGDMTRRALFCQLDPQVERPELRRFDTNPLREAQRHRSSLVTAALTILRAYHIAGQPDAPAPLGSYEAWSNRVRGSLIWLGEADPVLTLDTARELDPRLEASFSILSQWQSAIGQKAVSVRDVIDQATQQITSLGQGFASSPRHEFSRPDFREALLVIAGDGGAINSKRLGKWLAAHQNRVIQGLSIQRDSISAGVQRWRLIQQEGHQYVRAA